MAPTTIFSCPGGCPPGQCDTKGAGEEGTTPCHLCGGSGHQADDVYGIITCQRCNGDGIGTSYSSATCSKCGQSAISRSMWEGP